MPNGTLPPGFVPFSENMAANAVQLFNHTYSKKRKAEPVDEKAPMKAREGFTFGADPEFFLVNDKGVIVPGTPDLIPGTKEAPYAVDCGAVQLDGVAAEINVDAAKTFEEWSGNFDAVIAALNKMLPKGWGLSTKSSHVFDKDLFDPIPDSCKVLGCSPDFNAWEMNVNPPPEMTDPYLRCIGGHLHIGWATDVDVTDIQHILACADLSKQLDWFLACFALMHDKDTTRRQLYGKAGSCRIKHYGVEYRVLSSFWVLDKELRLEVWNRMQQAIRQMSNYYMPDRGVKRLNGLVQESINTGKLNPGLLDAAYFPIMTTNERHCRL
jgi:hypothetical protein